MVVVVAIAVHVAISIETTVKGLLDRLQVELLGHFPGKLVATKVAVARSLLVERLVQVQITGRAKRRG